MINLDAYHSVRKWKISKAMTTKTNAKTTTNTSLIMIRIVINLCTRSISFYVIPLPIANVNVAPIKAPIKCNISSKGSQVAIVCAFVRLKSTEVSKPLILTRNSYAACHRPIKVSAVNHLNLMCFLLS